MQQGFVAPSLGVEQAAEALLEPRVIGRQGEQREQDRDRALAAAQPRLELGSFDVDRFAVAQVDVHRQPRQRGLEVRAATARTLDGRGLPQQAHVARQLGSQRPVALQCPLAVAGALFELRQRLTNPTRGSSLRQRVHLLSRLRREAAIGVELGEAQARTPGLDRRADRARLTEALLPALLQASAQRHLAELRQQPDALLARLGTQDGEPILEDPPARLGVRRAKQQELEARAIRRSRRQRRQRRAHRRRRRPFDPAAQYIRVAIERSAGVAPGQRIEHRAQRHGSGRNPGGVRRDRRARTIAGRIEDAQPGERSAPGVGHAHEELGLTLTDGDANDHAVHPRDE